MNSVMETWRTPPSRPPCSNLNAGGAADDDLVGDPEEEAGPDDACPRQQLRVEPRRI